MLSKIKNYIIVFFAGVISTLAAWLALSHKKPSTPEPETKTALDLIKAQTAEEQIKKRETPKTLADQEQFLKKEGYLK